MKMLKRSQRGVALLTVLVLSAVSLALMTALIYMITMGTEMSGMQKRYRTSLEAAQGGVDLLYKLINKRGDTTETGTFVNQLSDNNMSPTLASACTGSTGDGTPVTGVATKLKAPSSKWLNCSRSLSIDPADPSTYDMKLSLGVAPNKYDFYAKIVETVEGNTGGGAAGLDTELIKEGVVTPGSGEIPVKPNPYLYAIEVLSSSSTNTFERSKMSVLYQY